jgi:hypothetical protein
MPAGRKPDINKYNSLLDKFDDQRLIKLFSKSRDQIKSEGYNRVVRDRLSNITDTTLYKQKNLEKSREWSRKSYEKNKEKNKAKKKEQWKNWYSNLSKEQKRERVEEAIKHYHANKEFRDNQSKKAKLRRQKMSIDEKNLEKKKSRAYAKVYAKKQQSKLDITGDYKVFLQWKRRKVKASSRARGIEFNLSKDFLYELYEKQKGNCYYTGKKMVLKIYSGIKPNRENIEKFKDYLTIDRLDSSKGYEKGNVALCTLKVNTAKGSLNYDEFLQIANFVKKRDFNIN